MQAVADLQFLQLAQMIVELFQRRVGIVAGADAKILVQAGDGGQTEDLAPQNRQPAGIDSRRLVILVHQPLQLA